MSSLSVRNRFDTCSGCFLSRIEPKAQQDLPPERGVQEMAQRVVFIDDLTDEVINDGPQPLKLTVNGADVEWEVSARTVKAFEYLAKGDLLEFMNRMQPVLKNLRPDSEMVRNWAKSNGITVGAKGAIPADVIAKFRAATQQNGR